MPAEYLLREQSIADLPCLVLSDVAAADDTPTVLVLHGLGGHKESALPTLYALARRGLRAIAPDVRLHGERSGAAQRDARLEADYLSTMVEMIEGTASDVSRLLDHLSAVLVAVHGISLGGYIAFAVLAADPRITVGSVAMGSPDFLEPLRALGVPPEHPLYRALAQRSPLERADVFPQRPLLLQHGDMDERVSIAGVRALYERLLPLYQPSPERLELTVYPGLGHYYTDAMVERAADWIGHFLATSPQ